LTPTTNTNTKTKTSKTAAVITPLPSSLLDQKIDEITAGLPASFGNNLRLLPNQQNIFDYRVYSSNED
jgi:hypothetical protein